jgi:hypothetical protein
MAGRSFTDDEVARILARAAELQADREQRGTGLDDIERAAAEAGIDPSLVRAAAGEMEGVVRAAPADAKTHGGFFGPTRVSLQAVIDGEVDPAEFSHLNEVVSQSLGVPAVAQQLGNSLQWTYQNPQTGRGILISMSTRDGRTTVRVSESFGSLMGGIYGGVGGGGGAGGVVPALAVAGAILLGPVGGVVGGLVGAAASLLGTRALYLAIARSRERQLQRTFTALEAEVRAVARPVRAEADSLDDARARQGLAAAPEEQRAQLEQDLGVARRVR